MDILKDKLYHLLNGVKYIFHPETEVAQITDLADNYYSKTEVDAKLVTVYKAGGQCTFAALPALGATYMGYVFDVSDAFTTTDSFLEGAGKAYPAHTNVAIVVRDGTYYYDANTGLLDGYATLASPALTGTPTAPTAPEWTNTTQLATTAYVMKAIANAIAIENVNFATLKELTASGQAPMVLPVGSQIITNWADKAANVTYAVPWDIVHYGNVTLQDGEIVPGMFLQWHYATPFGVQFNNFQAFYYAATALTAGTYYITLGSSWGKNVVSGKSYQFTLTKDVPVGGQLSGFEACPDKDPSNWKVKSWSSTSATTELETVSVTEGTGGTLLGTLKIGGDGTLNDLQRTGYGYNRWGVSAMRQWLNSSKELNSWWTPQHNFDRRPNELLTKKGFLSGFTDDFLSALTPVKVTTALNTITDSAVGTTEDTYDKIFLPSLQQEYITPQLADVEGDSWDYWKRASGRTAYAPWSTNMAEYITYGIDSKTSAQPVRLRSANRGGAYCTWYVYTTGAVGSYNSNAALRCAPACVIC